MNFYKQNFPSLEKYILNARAPTDSGVCEGVVLTSDSESEIFCDSVDSVEQLGNVKVRLAHILRQMDVARVAKIQNIIHSTAIYPGETFTICK